MSFHDDEFFINLNRKDKQAINATDKAEIDGIDKDIFYIDENGRFKWDIEFKERPLKNSWTWELKHADGIEFYYQGELTDEEIKDGCGRPAEVVGSYAVYCNKANNKYKTGKLCHIYRPFCYDINGESIYADLLIADGQLTITIDESWLDNAVYPVRLDPTIGYTSTPGSTTATSGSGYMTTGIAGTDLIADSSGLCNKMYIYVSSIGTGLSVNVGIYNNNESGASKLTSGAKSSSWNTGWNSINCTEITVTSGNKYPPAIGLVSNSGSGTVGYDTTNSSGNASSYWSTQSSLPSTWEQNPNRTYVFGVYLEYTESGGSPLPAIINNYRQQGVM